jgi:hypothetical protein
MTVDKKPDDQIPAEHMVSDRQPITTFEELMAYLKRVNCIDVEDEFHFTEEDGSVQYRRGTKRMFCNPIETKTIQLAFNETALIEPVMGCPVGHPKAIEGFTFRMPYRIVYQEDGFHYKGRHFRYVRQRDQTILSNFSEAEIAEQQRIKQERKEREDKLNFQFYFGGSEEKRREAWVTVVNNLAARKSIRTVNELLAYVREVRFIYVSGDYQGREYRKDEVKISITRKYIWLDHINGQMVPIPRPDASAIQFHENGFATGGFTFEYTTHPSQVPTVAAMIRKRP